MNVHGTGYYEGGATCTLTASANEGFFFGSWKKDGAVVSYDPTYSFTVLGDATYEAYFPKKEKCIQFADINVKVRCVALWDTNNDGELSYAEAATVTDLGGAFNYGWEQMSPISSFDELQYFTGLTIIWNGDFANNRDLTSIRIPKSVDTITGNPFIFCLKLASIVVDDRNENYDSRENCNAIIDTKTNALIVGCNNTIIPNSVVKIAASAFHYSGLTSIVIPNSVLLIGDRSFYGCNELLSITIPPPVLSIGKCAFSYCEKMASLTIGESVKEMGTNVLEYCENLERVNYNAVECEYVEVNPNEYSGPFFRSATKTLIIGRDVRSLPKGFWYLGIEESIVVRAPIPPESDNAAPQSLFDTPICVPKSSLSAYQNHEFWGQFTNYSTSYLFDVRSSDETIGRVRILEQPDCYSDNNIATILAESIGDHPFINWTSNGQVISTANPYTFAVEDDVELVANFYGTGVDEELERQILVSPNPTKGEVIVEGVIMKSMVVFTMDGRVSRVYEGLNTDAVSLDFKDLPQGVYMLRITTQNGAVINKKIIKE